MLFIVFMVIALATSGAALHEHDIGAHDASHADCDACHFRHIAGVESDGAPAPSAPDIVIAAVASAYQDGERDAALGIHPTRGPPT